VLILVLCPKCKKEKLRNLYINKDYSPQSLEEYFYCLNCGIVKVKIEVIHTYPIPIKHFEGVLSINCDLCKPKIKQLILDFSKDYKNFNLKLSLDNKGILHLDECESF
jgi:transcription elongation factor Elf1